MSAEINVKGGVLADGELEAYRKYVTDNHPGRTLEELEIEVDGEYVNLSYKFAEIPFDRVRRITGYLVGTMEKWNNAKAAEERDRVKHNL